MNCREVMRTTVEEMLIDSLRNDLERQYEKIEQAYRKRHLQWVLFEEHHRICVALIDAAIQVARQGEKEP